MDGFIYLSSWRQLSHMLPCLPTVTTFSTVITSALSTERRQFCRMSCVYVCCRCTKITGENRKLLMPCPPSLDQKIADNFFYVHTAVYFYFSFLPMSFSFLCVCVSVCLSVRLCLHFYLCKVQCSCFFLVCVRTSKPFSRYFCYKYTRVFYKKNN